MKQKIIYCLEYPTDLNIKKTTSVINLLKKYSNDVLIKNHPRDTKQYFFPKSFTTVDRHVAFESLCYKFEGIVISNSSSVLHTAKFISPNITVICTKFIDTPFNLDSSDFNYISMLKNLGVLFPRSLDELKNLIAEHY